MGKLSSLIGQEIQKEKITGKLLETGRLVTSQQAEHTYNGAIVVKEIDIDLTGKITEKEL